MKRKLTCSTILVLAVLSLPIPTFAQRAPSASTAAAVPEITSPKHRDKVPRQGIDPPCKPGPGCSVVSVEGRVPVGKTPFLAVAPLQATPKIWLQPKVLGVRRDGTFEGIVYLGNEKAGIGERFTIYVFACTSAQRFKTEDIIETLPADCTASDPVTVTRVQ